MKSTNRQFHLKYNSAKNYLKMCLLNCILISIVTLTHSLPIPKTLSGAIDKYPKYQDTLLNSAVVPFVNECATDKLSKKQKMLCGSYFEMIDKLDHSNVQGLTTVDDLTKAMNVYNQTNYNEFCVKFPSYIPNDPKLYPYSYQLPNLCQGYCPDDDLMVKQICKVFAIGFQLSNVDVQSVQPIVASSTVNELSAEGIRNSGNVRPDISARSDTSGSVKLDQGKLSEAIPIIGNGTDANAVIKPKQVVDETIPKAQVDKVDENIHEEKIDMLGKNAAKDNSAAEDSQNLNVADGDAKTDATSPIKSDATPTVKPTAKTSNLGENPMINEKTPDENIDPRIDGVQPNEGEQPNEGDQPKNENEQKDVNRQKEGDYTVIADGNDNDIFPNIDDSAENHDDDDIDTQVAQSAKSPPEQSPSNQQLHNQEDPFTDDTDSNFFTYFMFLLLACVIAYVVYHNKSKMLALMLEGRRSSTNGRGGLSRRKHTAAYRKLDSNLEEAITSSGNGRSTQVIY